MERVTGIEPVSTAWKAAALPLCYTRGALTENPSEVVVTPGPRVGSVVARAGFEPAVSGLNGRRPSPLDERASAPTSLAGFHPSPAPPCAGRLGRMEPGSWRTGGRRS